jgi:nucleoside-diphosphate-sugar epimerase
LFIFIDLIRFVPFLITPCCVTTYFCQMKENFSPLNISVLGCGWLGLPLLRSLVDAGHHVKGSARTSEPLMAIKAAGGIPFRIDLPGEIPEDFIGDHDSTLIITLPPRGRQLGPAATEHYLTCLQSISDSCSGSSPRVLFTSSTGVYGEAKGEVTENTPPQPNTHSSRAVLAAEEWVQTRFADFTILRLAGLIAEDRHPGRFYGGRDRLIPNSEAPVNLVHRADVISAIHLLLKKPQPKNIFNVCAADHPLKGEFYKKAANSLGLQILGLKKGGEGDKKINSHKLRELGWEPHHENLM